MTLRGLQSAPEAATAPIAGFHLFPFGGLRKSGEWLRSYGRENLELPSRASADSASVEPEAPRFD